MEFKDRLSGSSSLLREGPALRGQSSQSSSYQSEDTEVQRSSVQAAVVLARQQRSRHASFEYSAGVEPGLHGARHLYRRSGRQCQRIQPRNCI